MILVSSLLIFATLVSAYVPIHNIEEYVDMIVSETNPITQPVYGPYFNSNLQLVSLGSKEYLFVVSSISSYCLLTNHDSSNYVLLTISQPLELLNGVAEKGHYSFGSEAFFKRTLINWSPFVKTQKTASWFDALIFCHTHGMDLVSIENRNENNQLKKYLNTLGHNQFRLNYVYNIWTSGTKLGHSRWMWLNGESLDFTDWAENEPNNPFSEDCIALFVSDGHVSGWNDAPCEFTEDSESLIQTGFICERSPTASTS